MPNIREFIISHSKRMIVNGRIHFIAIDLLFVMWFAIRSENFRMMQKKKAMWMNGILGCSSKPPTQFDTKLRRKDWKKMGKKIQIYNNVQNKSNTSFLFFSSILCLFPHIFLRQSVVVVHDDEMYIKVFKMPIMH